MLIRTQREDTIFNLDNISSIHIKSGIKGTYMILVTGLNITNGSLGVYDDELRALAVFDEICDWYRNLKNDDFVVYQMPKSDYKENSFYRERLKKENNR